MIRVTVQRPAAVNINPHHTCGPCRTPPVPPHVQCHEHAQVECNRPVKLTLTFLSRCCRTWHQLWNKRSCLETLKRQTRSRWVLISQTPVSYDIWYMTYDIWHMIYDTWYVTYKISNMICDVWRVICDRWYMTYTHFAYQDFGYQDFVQGLGCPETFCFNR